MPLNEPSRPDTQSDETSAARLVGTSFGLIVWAIYFLVVYIGEAIFCTLLPGPTAEARLLLRLALAAATAIALVPVAVHSFIHVTADRTLPDKDFLSRLALGLDGIAAIGIVWMLIPILLVPACH